ncbi:MAG: AAC(3) family N-acetyltransferase [Bryobacterales bacterium]
MHTSFRRVGPVAGGAAGLIAALRKALGPDGTLVMPAWPAEEDGYDPATTPVARDLGITAAVFARMAETLRSPHVQAFAAAGPHAASIVDGPLPLPPHIPASPVGKVHDLNGQILLLGVGHDTNTTLHLAELIAGVPYGIPRVCLGTPYRENDHCCERFTLAEDWLRADGLQSEGPVGHGHARLMRSRDVVRLTVERLRLDPLLFLHPAASGCAECDAARDSIVAECDNTSPTP